MVVNEIHEYSVVRRFIETSLSNIYHGKGSFPFGFQSSHVISNFCLHSHTRHKKSLDTNTSSRFLGIISMCFAHGLSVVHLRLF